MDQQVFLPVYGASREVMARGEGVWLWSQSGSRYLDFTSGIAVNLFGHAYAPLREAVLKTMGKYTHLSNLYLCDEQVELANQLSQKAGMPQVFLCNSGTEANEAAIKFVRKYFYTKGNPEKNLILSFENSFHGRTYGALAATGQEKMKKGFGPMLAEFECIPLNDIEALSYFMERNAHRIAAVIMEPIQGEGGIHVPSSALIEQITLMQSMYGVKLICDEIQTGLGRTGYFLASQRLQLKPDIVTLAKPLGGGLPLGAVLVSEEIAKNISAGDHGSTFGGNPVACAAGLAVLQGLDAPGFLDEVFANGIYLQKKLEELASKYCFLGVVRGLGLMLGMTTTLELPEFLQRCREHGLLLLRAGTNVIRFLPPLNVTVEEIDQAIAKLDTVFKSY
jgi:acetylornithine/N-succinyldiaminopimelate aminotransferase